MRSGGGWGHCSNHTSWCARLMKKEPVLPGPSYTQVRLHGGGGGGGGGVAPSFFYFFIYLFCLSAQGSVRLMMIIPLRPYPIMISLAQKKIQVGKKMCRSPTHPGFLFCQTPWRRAWLHYTKLVTYIDLHVATKFSGSGL